MTDINTLLEKNSTKVNILLRRYRVVGPPTMATVEKAYREKGEPFMMRLLEILVPDQSNFESLITPKSAILESSVIDTKTLATSASTSDASTTTSTGGFWSFWNKLLNSVSETGKTIGDFKTDIQTKPIDYEYQLNQQSNSAQFNRLLTIAVVALVLLIIIAIIFKR